MQHLVGEKFKKWEWNQKKKKSVDREVDFEELERSEKVRILTRSLTYKDPNELLPDQLTAKGQVNAGHLVLANLLVLMFDKGYIQLGELEHLLQEAHFASEE